MTKQFAKKSIAAALTTAALAFVAVSPVGAADQSEDWFEQQRAITDGANVGVHHVAASADKGPRGRVGVPAASLEGQAGSSQEEWLERQRRVTDGSPE
jgi:hypothetical protein